MSRSPRWMTTTIQPGESKTEVYVEVEIKRRWWLYPSAWIAIWRAR